MELLRGRRETPAADRAVTDDLVERARDGETVVRCWVPPRQLAFGRRDTREDGYEQARERAKAHEFPPTVRRVGGRAVAFDGTTTVSVAHAGPTGEESIAARYDRALDWLETALTELGVTVHRQEPEGAFCPGSCSLSTGAGKVAGLAQRVTAEAALVAGVVIVAGAEELAPVLEAVYDALGVEFDPRTVGTVAGAGGPSTVEPVRSAIEAAITDGQRATVESV